MTTRELGDYLLLKQLGRGSLGLVYLAEHRFMKKQCAIKILPEELSVDRNFIQRFQEDVSRLASLQHPNIAAIHNVCFHDGIYFLVTDCIVDNTGESTNLYHYLKSLEHPLDEETLIHHLSQIADALDYAHAPTNNNKGIIHRGIKLSNILVGSDSNDKTAWYLSDFGLSRIIGCGAVLTRTLKTVAETISSPALWTQAANDENRYPFPPLEISNLSAIQHSFLQNFVFLAPEQKCIDGVSPITHKADIYAFGVLVYYILTGTFPEGYFSMPSEINPNLKYRWDKLVAHCLRPDPAQRPEKLAFAISALKEEEGEFQHYAIEIPAYANANASKLQKEIDQGLIAPGNIGVMDKYQAEPETQSQKQADSPVKHYTPERKEQKSIQPLMTETKAIQGGTFWRGSGEGSRDEMPPHQVHIDTFKVDIHPVTNEQFVRFLEYVGGEKDSYHRDLIRLRDSRIKRSGGKLSIESGYSKHPVVGVTWYGAMAYAKWVGKRLPTEAEWEIAAAIGHERQIYPTGDDIEKSQANFFSSDTTAVMSYAPNTYGLYDMAGNVYEWCQDWYGYNYYEISQQEPDNPKGPLQGNYRVLRGGCWKSLKEDLRSSKRHRNNPGTVNSTYGFRCAAD